jgi:hypothetical protein
MTDDPRRAPGADLPQWIDQLTAALGVDRELVDIDRLLQVSSDVAHQIARPAVPVTMFVAGLAAASSHSSDVLAFIEARAADWTAEQ